LVSGAVDDASDFVGDYKLKVLGGKFVTGKNSVFNFNCSENSLHIDCAEPLLRKSLFNLSEIHSTES
jgi:hypothetical protein